MNKGGGDFRLRQIDNEHPPTDEAERLLLSGYVCQQPEGTWNASETGSGALGEVALVESNLNFSTAVGIRFQDGFGLRLRNSRFLCFLNCTLNCLVSNDKDSIEFLIRVRRSLG